MSLVLLLILSLKKPLIGLNEDIIKLISSKKSEPEWLLNYRLKAFANMANHG